MRLEFYKIKKHSMITMIPIILAFFVQLLLLNCHGAQTSENKKTVNVGAIVDLNSVIGREQRISMEIAAQNYNEKSKSLKLLLNFRDSRREALQSASSAEEMIREKKAEVIVGMETWQAAALVGKVGNRTQVPVISLAPLSITPPQMRLRWPFLVTLASDDSAETACIADLARIYGWRKVVAIYEDDEQSGDFGALALLDEALQKNGSEIEYRLVLPPYSSLANPKGFVLDELAKLLTVQSRAFVVLRCTSPMVNHLFREAKKLGLLERDSAWIITENIISSLDSVDNSIVPLPEGTLGITTHYSNTTSGYKDFRNQFQRALGEHIGNTSPGIHALRAHDSIQTITQALEKSRENSGKVLLNNILSVHFDGLGGKVSFEEGKLSNRATLRIVNVVGTENSEPKTQNMTYKKLSFWTREHGFYESIGTRESEINGSTASIRKSSADAVGSVVWPGNMDERNPKGWAMPTIRRPLKIGVPGNSQFSKFVAVDQSKKHVNEGYDGFCIRVFKMALGELNYDLPFQFYSFSGPYDELVEAVRNKTFDAAVGDITILEGRSKDVDYTQPYLESGLALVMPVKKKESAWIFLKPFTWEVWVLTVGVLMYMVFIVWFLEHPTNSEFNGSVKKQISTALWFTFSSLFFAQRERIKSNLTRVTVTVWLFHVFIISASYTANLSSMLTVKNLEHNVGIDWLKQTNQKVGCDGDSFIRRYLKDALGFKPENIINVNGGSDYVDRFTKKNITAAFLEQPYEKVFLNENCDGYASAAGTFKFAGLGFVFQKGSPMVRDVSKAILKLSENGNITKLEKECLTPKDCSQSAINGGTESLSIKSFWGIYLISGFTCTACFLASLIRLEKSYRNQTSKQEQEQTVKSRVLGLARFFYFYEGEAKELSRSIAFRKL